MPDLTQMGPSSIAGAAAASVILLLLALGLGCQFYPPGYGYADERRNGQIATALFAASVVSGLLAFYLLLTSHHA